MNRQGARGFSLVELMIVVAVISVILTLAVPNFISSRTRANEKAALTTMRNLVNAQSQVQTTDGIDVDRDGQGEFAYWGELSGVDPVRGETNPLLAPGFSPAFGEVRNSRVTRSGYAFQIYLPDAAGAGVAEDPSGGKANPAELDTNLAEQFWCAYAWPMVLDNTGSSAYFVNQGGEILRCTNRIARYAGPTRVPAPDAAFLTASSIIGDVAFGATGQDGETWVQAQ